MSNTKTVSTIKTTPVMMRLPEDLVSRVDDLAQKMYISRNSAFCQALGYWCDSQEVQKNLASSEFIERFIKENPDFVKGFIKDDE